MDGSFVPRFGIYPEIVQDLSLHTNVKFDLHLMVNDIIFAEQFLPVKMLNMFHSTLITDQVTFTNFTTI